MGKVTQLVFGGLTSGAESDLEQLTRIARHMVGRWGMSDAIGPIALAAADGSGPFAPKETSPRTQQVADEEVHAIVTRAQADVVALLQDNRAKLDSLAQALLEHETLDEADAYAAAGVSPARNEPGSPQAIAA